MSKSEASFWLPIPNLEGLNLPLGSAKKLLSSKGTLFCSNVNSFLLIVLSSNFFSSLLIAGEKVASLGIGFLTVLCFFSICKKFCAGIGLACALTAVTLFPASLDCLLNGSCICLTVPPALNIVLPAFV